MTVITRFPPSPTGNLHIGGARTALFNYLFTKKQSGKMYLRLENTDEERSKPEYEQNIFDSLAWLGLAFDPIGTRPFWRQSERKHVYRSYLQTLVSNGKAYLSKETEGKRQEVVRFRNPNKKVAFDDLIRGHIAFDTTELGDMVIARSLAEPLYHLAVVIDDNEMGVTHIIRGEDGISNTARQILLQEALGFSRPEYAHIPLILAPDRSKLSKRHGAVSITEYRDKGFLPEAVINYLALLGWNPGTEQELFTLEELIEKFDLAKVQKGGAIFNEEKLRSMNREYLKKLGPVSLRSHIPKSLLAGRNELQIEALAEMLSERISVFNDIQEDVAAGEFNYLIGKPKYPKELLRWKKATDSPKVHLENIFAILEKMPGALFTKSDLKGGLTPYAEAEGKGNVLWPMRVALSGREQSPDPFILAAILGKNETLGRLQSATAMLK